METADPLNVGSVVHRIVLSTQLWFADGRDSGSSGQKREGMEDAASNNVVPSRKDPLRTAVQQAAASGVLVADSSFDKEQQDQTSPIMTASFDAI